MKIGIAGLFGLVFLLGCDARGSGLTAIQSGSTPTAELSSLAISSGALSPPFSGSTLAYTVTVTNATTNISVTPTAAASGAVILVNGSEVLSGTSSQPITLSVGANTINVFVTAADGVTSRNYQIIVTRAP